MGGFRTVEGDGAFITGPNGMGMRHLGGNSRETNGINGAGQVVGYFITTEGDHHAFITGPDGGAMMDLNSLVDLPQQWVIANASDINNSGQIVAYITRVPEVPEPQIYGLLLAGLSLVGFAARRKKAEKLLKLLSLFCLASAIHL